MKFVGIIKEHEGGLVKIGTSINNLTILDNPPLEHLDKIVSYLENGKRVISFLHEVFDGKTSLGALSYLTDGKWIWPSYLAYYLKRGYKSLLDNEFIKDVVKNDFIIPPLNNEEMREVGLFYRSVYAPNIGHK